MTSDEIRSIRTRLERALHDIRYAGSDADHHDASEDLGKILKDLLEHERDATMRELRRA